jgi:hypothetical protein
MRRRVFVIGGEYGANPRHLPAERRSRAWLGALHDEPPQKELERLFFRYPNRSEDGRTRPEDWLREFGIDRPVGLSDLFASAAARALGSLHRLLGGSAADYEKTRDAITDLYVTAMPGLDPNERTNIGLVPQMLKGMLGLSPRTRAQFLVGTSDAGAWAFAQAVRAARLSERPATILVLAGQLIPSGYASQYQIRTVLGEEDQARGLDMLAVGDLLMDVQRRTAGLSRAEVEAHLTRASQKKLGLSAAYPAGFSSGKPSKRSAKRTPYFDGNDIAAPCCGAAVTILSSDEELVARVAAAKSPRYRRLPAVEVLGVGEGSTNANFLHREAPLAFATAVREALATTAEDAQLPLSTFSESSFAVLHDAFPSIELAFLLSMGLPIERAMDRVREGWSNPLGGLLGFGHALGASGLVQVIKTLHLFSGDTRYLRDGHPGATELCGGFREGGAISATSSVGGPLSHVVGGLFRGGFLQLPQRVHARERRVVEAESPLTSDWIARRRELRLALPRHHAEVAESVARLGHSAETLLLEGQTVVSIRSCLKALTPEVIATLRFEGLEQLLRPERLEAVRATLRELVLVLLHESERLPSLFDVFKLLSDELHEQAGQWSAAGWTLPGKAELPAEKLADAIKECLRVPLAITYGRGHGAGNGGELGRQLRYLPLPGPGGALLEASALEDTDVLLETGAPGAERFAPLDPAITHAVLPFWDARARREDGPLPLAAPGTPAQALVQALLGPGARLRQQASLDLLRAWFAAATPAAALEVRLRAAGAPPAQELPALHAFAYACRVESAPQAVQPGVQGELLAHAVQQACAWLGAFETRAEQLGDGLSMLCFQPAGRWSLPAALLAASRFSREVAQSALAAGLVVRAAVTFGAGEPYADLHGEQSVATGAVAAARALLPAGPPRPALPEGAPSVLFEVQGLSPLHAEALQRSMSGWESARAEDPAAYVFWRGAPAKE